MQHLIPLSSQGAGNSLPSPPSTAATAVYSSSVNSSFDSWTMASSLTPRQQSSTSASATASSSPWDTVSSSSSTSSPSSQASQIAQPPTSHFSPFSPYAPSETQHPLPVQSQASLLTSSIFPTSRTSRHSSFANNDTQRPVFQNTNVGGSSSLSSVSSATSSVSSNTSYSSVARSGSFSAGTATLSMSGRGDDYSLGAALFHQSSTTSTTPNSGTSTARPSYLTSPSPSSAVPSTFRRTSFIELEHGQPQPFSINMPFSGSVTPQRFSPLTGTTTSTVGGPTSLPSSNNSSSTSTPLHEVLASTNVLDRFSNLAQLTRDAELISNGMKQMELNSDATPITTHPHSNHQSRHGSVSSNFFPSPSVSSDVFSPFGTHAFSRSNSVTTNSMWHQHTPVSSGSVSTVVSPSGLNTVHLSLAESNGNGSIDPSNPTSPLFDAPNMAASLARSPLFTPHYASVFSSPANSASGLSDNWPGSQTDNEFAYSSSAMVSQTLDSRLTSSVQSRTPPTRPLSRLSNAGLNSGINSDRNLRQQLAHQQQNQVQAQHAQVQQQQQQQQQPQPQQTQQPQPQQPPHNPTFRFNSSQSFHPQNSEHSNYGRSNHQSEFNHSRGSGNNNFRRHHADYASNIRSPLLEEFRGNKNKKYELKDIFGHVVEFSGDQYGSRFIQQRLENASSEEKAVIFEELRSNSIQLMTDVFGNYVIQKFFELGNQEQKSVIAKQMEGSILNLSLQMYGCRVVQKAIEHIHTDQQAILIKELDGYVLQCVKDQNGNHVVQKAIERIPAQHIGFIIDAFNNQVYNLATHPYGCRVIQRMLEHCEEDARKSILAELHGVTFDLIEDQYGNYVIQHVIERGMPEDREQVMLIVRNSILSFSRHKFASNVVEKCIIHGSSLQRDQLIEEILRPRANDGVVPLNVMMKDQFANYVIQKLLDVTKGEQHDRLVEAIKPHLQHLKKFTYGKHLASIEKLINQAELKGKS